MSVEKSDLVKILDGNTGRQWTDAEVSDKMVADFNKEFTSFLKLYPSYDPMAVDDYLGQPDDDFLELLNKVLVANGQKQLFKESVNVEGSALVNEGWPSEYNGKKFDSEECEEVLDNHYAGISWEAAKASVAKFPSKIVRAALNKNMGWRQFKNDAKSHLAKLAAFNFGPDLDGNTKCWTGREDGPAQAVRVLMIKDLANGSEVAESIMEALEKNHPMTPHIKAVMKMEVVPNLHFQIINESSLELDAEEFADIAAALNSTAQNLAGIVHGFISKAIAKAKEINGKDKDKADGGDGNSATDVNQEVVACFQECLTAGLDEKAALAKCAELCGMSEAEIREILTAMNVNLASAAETNADNTAASPAPASGTTPVTEDDKTATNPNNPFSLSVNKQYQTASGQVLVLRKMSGGTNPSLVFEDENTGEKVELLQDKFFKMNPKESDIDSTKSRKSLINKFKKRINLTAMKKFAKIVYKSSSGRKIYEALDSIKTNGRPVGDIAGVVIGSGSGADKNQVEYNAGDTVKAGDVEGQIKGFKMNEAEEPEIIVKTPEGDEVTITVADYAEAEPMHVEPADIGMEEEPTLEHVEYKGYALLQNAEDQTWSVLKDDAPVEGQSGLSEADAKAFVDAAIEEEGGEGSGDGSGASDNGEEEVSEAKVSSRFITESKDGAIKLKTFSQVLSEAKIPGLSKNLVSTKKPAKK